MSGALARFLIARGERIVRVAPKHMAGARRSSRERGKSDSIDAFAVARAALKEGIEKLPGAHLDGAALDIRLLSTTARISSQPAAKIGSDCAGISTTLWPELEIPPDAKLARTGGAAPIPASSGNTNRHRLDRGGNRQVNCALHRLAVNKATWDPDAAAYLARKQAEGKSRTEALRCLKRHLARRVWRLLRSPRTKTPLILPKRPTPAAGTIVGDAPILMPCAR